MDTTVCNNGAVQFNLFLVIRLNIIIVTSCPSFIVIFVLYFLLLKFEIELKKHVRNVA